MNKLQWLKGYTGQSTDELISLEGEYRTDSIVSAFEQALHQKADRIGIASLSREESIVLAVEALEREINNGGYDQFFSNSSNIYADLIVEALNSIGHEEVANITCEAIEALGVYGLVTVEAIERSMSQIDEKRDETLRCCDDRYYESAGDIADSLLQFIKANRIRIIL